MNGLQSPSQLLFETQFYLILILWSPIFQLTTISRS